MMSFLKCRRSDWKCLPLTCPEDQSGGFSVSPVVTICRTADKLRRTTVRCYVEPAHTVLTIKFCKRIEGIRMGLKMVPVTKAVGMVLPHDMIEIIPGEKRSYLQERLCD